MLVAASGGDAAGVAGAVLVLLMLAAAMYFLPLIVAVVRHVPNIGSVAVINILLGWSFIGWVVALAMACRSTTPANQVHVYAQPPHSGQPQVFGQLPQYGQREPYRHSQQYERPTQDRRSDDPWSPPAGGSQRINPQEY